MKMFFKINEITTISSNILSIKFTKILKSSMNYFLNLITNVVGLIFQFSLVEYGRQLILENVDGNK
jgi:hypothetical protein